MITRGSLWLPLAILLLLAALSFWIERSVQLTETGSEASHTDPEGIMENFDALRTDPAGKPHYRLSAKKLKHYTGSKRTELESPRFVQLDVEAGEVSAVSRQATVSSDGQEVDLVGDVDLLRAPGAVEILDDTLAVRAGAMEYDAGQRVIKLTGRVHARYVSRQD